MDSWFENQFKLENMLLDIRFQTSFRILKNAKRAIPNEGCAEIYADARYFIIYWKERYIHILLKTSLPLCIL